MILIYIRRIHRYLRHQILKLIQWRRSRRALLARALLRRLRGGAPHGGRVRCSLTPPMRMRMMSRCTVPWCTECHGGRSWAGDETWRLTTSWLQILKMSCQILIYNRGYACTELRIIFLHSVLYGRALVLLEYI